MLNASDRAGSAGAADAELAVGVAAVEVIVAGVAAARESVRFWSRPLSAKDQTTYPRRLQPQLAPTVWVESQQT